MLDDQFQILPSLLTPKPNHDANVTPTADDDGERNSGAELQWLEKYKTADTASGDPGGFIDGISPFALAYNYNKRAEVLQTHYGQRHAQLSDMVVDSRPAIALKCWAEEEWEQGRRRELQAMELNAPEDRTELESAAANLELPLNQPVTDPA